LNDGQIALREDYGWNIIPAKELISQDLSKYHLIIVDEAQRIYPSQLRTLVGEVKKFANMCIFSYDGQQTVRKGEINNNVEEETEDELTIKPFELTNKIRTNKEVAFFINCLFSKKRPLEKYKYENIELNYFDNYSEARDFLKQLKSENWKIINYTPSKAAILP
jgi:hypothetical protein